MAMASRRPIGQDIDASRGWVRRVQISVAHVVRQVLVRALLDDILRSAKSGPSTAYYFHAECLSHVNNILSNVRADIRKYVVSWLKRLRKSYTPVLPQTTHQHEQKTFHWFMVVLKIQSIVGMRHRRYKNFNMKKNLI